MRLVIDASVLVGECLRPRGRDRLEDTRLEFFVPEQTLAETRYELPRRVAAFQRSRALPQRDADAMLARALAVVATALVPVDRAAYASVEPEARRRSLRDPRDWPLVASALILDCGVWTNDKDMLGTGVPTWTTETIKARLDHESFQAR